MKLRIVHQTVYTYHSPVAFGQHRLVLRPREGHDLTVESMGLTITPAFELAWSRDVFGNSIANVDFLEPSSQLHIVTDVIVNRSDRQHGRFRHAVYDTPRPPVYDPLDRLVASAYQQSVYPDDAVAVARWIAALPFRLPEGVRAAVDALNRHIRGRFPSKRREEKGVLTPAQTIARGSGSCRDLATLLLEAARSLGIAARFASGYLDCAASEAGEASTHAWTEIYLPGEGWIGFDPSLGHPTSEQHVVTGVSNHPRGVMPVSGSYFGKATEFKELKVSVLFEKTACDISEKPEIAEASATSSR